MVQGESPKEQKELLFKARPSDSDADGGENLDTRFGKSCWEWALVLLTQDRAGVDPRRK